MATSEVGKLVERLQGTRKRSRSVSVAVAVGAAFLS